jgi:hypothetical protein
VVDVHEVTQPAAAEEAPAIFPDLPAAQSVHWVASVNPSVLLHLPIGQSAQAAVSLVLPVNPLENLPAEQGVHCETSERPGVAPQRPAEQKDFVLGEVQ